MIAKAICRSAVTIINAMATGKGCTIGTGLRTTVEVTETGKSSLRTMLNGKPIRIDSKLVRQCISVFNKRFGTKANYSMAIDTQIIPMAGMKSSSSVSLAIMLALWKLNGRKRNNQEIIRMAIEASTKAGVTLTGAYDDCLGCYFGNCHVTDNKELRTIKKTAFMVKPVVLGYTNEKRESGKISNDFSGIKDEIDLAYGLAMKGELGKAAWKNSIAYSRAFGYGTTVLEELRKHSLITGLNGKGPSIYAIPKNSSRTRKIIEIMKKHGYETILTKTSSAKAHAYYY